MAFSLRQRTTLLRIESAIDKVVNRYYQRWLVRFWPPERKLVENFAEIPFPFHELGSPKFEMTAHWNLDYLVGYLGHGLRHSGSLLRKVSIRWLRFAMNLAPRGAIRIGRDVLSGR